MSFKVPRSDYDTNSMCYKYLVEILNGIKQKHIIVELIYIQYGHYVSKPTREIMVSVNPGDRNLCIQSKYTTFNFNLDKDYIATQTNFICDMIERSESCQKLIKRKLKTQKYKEEYEAALYMPGGKLATKAEKHFEELINQEK